MVEMVAATLNGEFPIILPKHRAERPEWYTEQGWEKARLRKLYETVCWNQENPVVYYVGAEEGEFPALCQYWGAQVYLFEPNPLAWPNIYAIWGANRLDPPKFAFAGFASNVTDYSTKTAHGWPAYWNGWPDCVDGPVVGDHGFKELYLEADNYPQIRIDDVVDDYGDPPTVLAFDVEGSEWQVLRGAEETLRQHKPILFASIHPEFMFYQWGEYSADFRRWIKDFGYKETILDYQHELHCMYEPA